MHCFSPFLIGMLHTRPKPLKGYPQWVKRGSREQGRTRRSNPPTSGTLDCQFPSLTSWVPPISPFQKKYKAFLHNKILPISPTSHPFRFPPPPYSLTSCTPPSSYSPRFLTPLSSSIRGTNRSKIYFLKKQPANGNIWTQNCKPLSVVVNWLVINCSPWLYEDIYLLQSLCFKWVITGKHPHWFPLF